MIGFLNINKPTNMTSAQAVARAKRLLRLDKSTKIGHTGTLDPMASGVLPLAVGRATKLFDYMLSKTKEYEAEFTFGYETDTLDGEGKVIATTKNIPKKDEIISILTSFIGKISQLPPKFSAKSVGGKRAYEMARKGEAVELKPCVVEVVKFELISNSMPNVFTFKIECGSGTYIRSLCRDLAHRLNSLATMTKLERTRVGVFSLDKACELNEVSENKILPCEVVLQKLESITVDLAIIDRLHNGKRVAYKLDKQDFVKVICDKKLMGLGKVENNNLKMKIWLT